ncbi:MAG: acyl-homoserine-lactone acylase [Bradymonadia bacterium]|jgi:acyl-homoserine-lactone acylase
MNRSRTVSLLSLSLALVACDDAPKSDSISLPAADEVEIRYTEHGIPHIRAANWEAASFGAGYAFSRDHICTLADQMVKIHGERSLYFGAGQDDEHLNSDFAYLHLHFVEDAEENFSSLEPELQGMLTAYADGVNRYLSDVGPTGLPTPCRNGAWVRPITGVNMLAYYLQLGGRGSSVAVAGFLATAVPPSSKSLGPSWSELPAGTAEAFAAELPDFRNPGFGSNGWALGSELTETGRGALFSNTHFPAEGELQWWEMHVEVADSDEAPGANVYGASLMGVFPLNMGFNEHVAWTHTVSTSPRLIGYRLELDPTSPTRYMYDGDWREMTSQEYTVQVLQADGTTASASRTLWRTHYGPMIDIQPLGWSSSIGISYRDANDLNLRMLPQWLSMNRATSLDEFAQSFEDIGGIPWVHTLAADREGEVYYIDAGSVPNLSPEASATYEETLLTDPIVQAAQTLGFILVDGSDPLFEWVDVDATRPGLVPASAAPTLRRRDFVSNSNDSHWATNPAAPLEDFHLLFGAERENFSLPRTRMSLLMLTESESPFIGTDGRWSVLEILDAATSGRASIAEALLDEVRQRCTEFGAEYTIEFDGADVTINPQTEICDVLASWDGLLGTQSTGAGLWRLAFTGQWFSDDEMRFAGTVFETPFDADDPVNTPSGLIDSPETDARLLEAFALAVLTLESVGIDPAAPLGDMQFQRTQNGEFPRVGGLEREGAFAIADWRGNGTLLPRVNRAPVVDSRSGLTEEGWVVNAGNSWVMAMEFTDDGPRGHALMTYGQSEDPASDHHDDQAERYVDLEWREIIYDGSELDDLPFTLLIR